ncbi:ImmA/IrrE family metallo-endopeptidase [Luteimonas sp. A482]
MTAAFNPTRLKIARDRKMMSMKKLADLAGLTTKSISNYESGETAPTELSMARICEVLGYPLEFFFGGDLGPPDAANASFRSFSRMTAIQRDSALAAGGFVFAVAAWIEERFNLPAVSVPDLAGMEPELAAEMVRSEWQLGVLPIKNMVHLLESKGVRVFSLSENTRQVNAFSAWRNGNTPFVFLNTMKSSESSRFDAAHELGHLVLHRHGENKGKAVEREADGFASALLMPKTEMMAYAGRCRSVEDIVRYKKRFNVSAMAFAFNLHKAGAISEFTYRSLCIEMSKRGMRTNEVDSSERETSQVLKKVFDALNGQGQGLRAIADNLSIPVEELHSLVFGLTSVSLGSYNPSPQATARKTGHLRVV